MSYFLLYVVGVAAGAVTAPFALWCAGMIRFRRWEERREDWAGWNA